MPYTPMPVADVGGVPFTVTTLGEAVEWTVLRASNPLAHGVALRLANAWCVTMANERRDYADLLRTGGVNFPDGTPVAWTLRRTGFPEAGRVRGPSFFTETLRRGRVAGLRHYFFGANDEVLARMLDTVQAEFPGTIVVGATAPDFRDDPAELAEQLPAHINKDTVDIVWVGLGSPKQDFVADAIAAGRGVVTAGVGAAFDFLAGTVSEAPGFVQDSGFEWLFRFAAEPRRLWRRYLVGNTLFLRTVLPQIAGYRPSVSLNPDLQSS